MSTENNRILTVENLKVFFDGDYGTTQIINDISFSVNAGETLGIVGESGCGKSITSLSVMRLLGKTARIEGHIDFCGTDVMALSKEEIRNIRGNKISMIFQDPMTSLNPVFTIGNQLSEVFRLHQGMSKDEALKASIEALKMVDVALPEKRVKEYPFQLSGGMRQRVMIAMALACKPQLLIADEPTTALDVTIQAQVLQLMRNLRDETGTAIMFITHDLGVVAEMCERAIVLYCGEIMEEASTKEIFRNPKHPYTEGLLAALPHAGQREGKLYVIPGTVPPAGHFPEGCVFAPRCKYATERCHREKPTATSVGEKHNVRCFKYESEV
ncbi:MAG: ABC transporter ATP-binding protein [Clostridia bacterium]|nr:ABC transporter ATP-binding protein [Clostridia bacterium]